MASFFVNLPSNSGPLTFPDNTATTFDTKFDRVRQLDGEWSIALVAMSHPARINNMVNGWFDLFSFAPAATPYWKKRWRRVYVPDGCYTSSIDMLVDMIKALNEQHPEPFPGIPFVFDVKHSRIVISPGAVVWFNESVGKAIGHYGPLMMSAGGRTMPGISKPTHTTTDMFHIHASILNDEQIYGDITSPLLRLVMYTGIQDEQVETVYHEFVNLHYKPVSVKTLNTLKIKITDQYGESVKFQDGKVVLTLHFKQQS